MWSHLPLLGEISNRNLCNWDFHTRRKSCTCKFHSLDLQVYYTLLCYRQYTVDLFSTDFNSTGIDSNYFTLHMRSCMCDNMQLRFQSPYAQTAEKSGSNQFFFLSYVTQICFLFHPHNSLNVPNTCNLIFSMLIWATFVCATKPDTGLMS